jgi:hypothetical protein
LVAVVGAAGILGLSGSQAFVPSATAYERPTPPSTPQAASPPITAPAPGPGLTWPTPAPGSSWSAVYPSGGFPTGAFGTGSSNPYGLNSSAGLSSSGIPQPAYQAYVNAARSLAQSDPACRLSWTVIAGIGRVESNHGRFGGSTIGADGVVRPPILGVLLDGSRSGNARISDSDGGRYDGNSSFDRAVGPMQFLPGTWKVYGNGADPQDMNAAALATARYLCAGSGDLSTQKGRWAAVYRYNHSDSYVSLVLSLADSYASGHAQPFPVRPAGTPTPPTTDPPATVPGPPPSVPKPPKTPKPPATPTGSPTPPTTPTTGPTPPGSSPTGSAPAPTTTRPRPTPTWSRPTTTRPLPTTTPPKTTAPSPTPTPSPTCATPTPTPTPTPTVTPTPAPGSCDDAAGTEAGADQAD